MRFAFGSVTFTAASVKLYGRLVKTFRLSQTAKAERRRIIQEIIIGAGRSLRVGAKEGTKTATGFID